MDLNSECRKHCYNKQKRQMAIQFLKMVKGLNKHFIKVDIEIINKDRNSA